MIAVHEQDGSGSDEKQRVQCELADIIRDYGPAFLRTHSLPLHHLRVMHAIEVCRTPYLGGTIEQCDACGFRREIYPSCGNRHCPKCQALPKAKWLNARMSELLPVPYFHLVFTLPHEINPLTLRNKRKVLSMLFQTAADTLMHFGGNSENGLGGQLGFLAILHTWNQVLLEHFHLHCVVPGGALSFDKEHWIPSHDKFLFYTPALSVVFRGKFMEALGNAYREGALGFHGDIENLKAPRNYIHLKERLWDQDWVVYAKRPFDGPERVLDYLGRYTHRVAISNNRIVSVHHNKVSFTYRDRQDADTVKTMTLEAEEFIRRFMLHILPEKFHKIRYYGFMANRVRKDNVALIWVLLDATETSPNASENPDRTTRELLLELTGKDVGRCPNCRKGTMIMLSVLSRPPSPTTVGKVNHVIETMDTS